MLLNNEAKRLAIYFFYDKDGIVDNYITYFLENLKKSVSYLYIVCNGKLNSSGYSLLKEKANKVLVRENKGFDVWAYKECLDNIGFENLIEYDEIVMLNSTIMGPIYPFSNIFMEMNFVDIDFWGLTVYNEVPFDPFGTIKYGYIPQHLQSHFIAVRKSMFLSSDFQKYWMDMPEIHSYEEAVGKHEAIFTKTFADLGYKWKAYVNTEDLKHHSYHPILMNPVELIKNRKCPVFKRRSFFHNYDELLNVSIGNQAYELMQYLQKYTNYDVDMIWQNIIRTQNMADIKRNLHLSYILPTEITIASINQNIKVALIMHIYFEDLIEYCYDYASSMPEYVDVYITTNTDEKKIAIEKIFKNLNCNNCKVMVIQNRGRDVSALLTASKDFIMQYDYICFAHDKKVKQLDQAIKGEAFSYHCFENILCNENYVKNIITTFEENPRLGLLTPPPPYHADYYPTISFEWGYNFDNTKKLADELGLQVDLSIDKEPIAPLGTMFWFRTDAMKKLFEKNWKYTDFPPEPNNTDGTLLHAIERIYPFVVQDAGYYCAWVISDRYARIETDNLYYMLSEINKISFKMYGFNSHYGLTSTMKYHYNMAQSQHIDYMDVLFKQVLKEKIKKHMPIPVWNFMKKIYYKLKRK